MRKHIPYIWGLIAYPVSIYYTNTYIYINLCMDILCTMYLCMDIDIAEPKRNFHTGKESCLSLP